MTELKLRLPMWIMVLAKDLHLHSDDYKEHAYKLETYKNNKDIQELMDAFVNGDKEMEEFIYKLFSNEVNVHLLNMKVFKEGDEHYEIVKRISDRRDEILRESESENLDTPKKFKQSKTKIDPKYNKPKEYATPIKARELLIKEKADNDAMFKTALEGLPYRGKVINVHDIGKTCIMLMSFTNALKDLLSGEYKLIVKDNDKKAFFITDNDELAEVNLYENIEKSDEAGFNAGELINFTYDPLIRKIELAKFYKGLEEEAYYGTNDTEILDDLTYKTVNELGLIMRGNNND